ncbi:pentatricopeptide repeat-containing protein [Trifolium pratense]|uniref:Pentatricopeptide repeat-containing protein n=1 Tax=Trifolium pratense TaxID=57577 RepID=A0A2K3MZ95_TRIPR|nr:pentatricopeptide repeat-containing protein [Trifolium pratense]
MTDCSLWWTEVGRTINSPAGSVEEFVEAFELLSFQVGRLPEEQYLRYFMGGLKPQIRRRVRTLNPSSRMHMMRNAKDVDEELREEDDEGDRSESRKSNMGRSDWVGSYEKSRSEIIVLNF